MNGGFEKKVVGWIRLREGSTWRGAGATWEMRGFFVRRLSGCATVIERHDNYVCIERIHLDT